MSVNGTRCPGCGNADPEKLKATLEGLVCTKCGVRVRKNIDDGRDWRTFSTDQDNGRNVSVRVDAAAAGKDKYGLGGAFSMAQTDFQGGFGDRNLTKAAQRLEQESMRELKRQKVDEMAKKARLQIEQRHAAALAERKKAEQKKAPPAATGVDSMVSFLREECPSESEVLDFRGEQAIWGDVTATGFATTIFCGDMTGFATATGGDVTGFGTACVDDVDMVSEEEAPEIEDSQSPNDSEQGFQTQLDNILQEFDQQQRKDRRNARHITPEKVAFIEKLAADCGCSEAVTHLAVKILKGVCDWDANGPLTRPKHVPSHTGAFLGGLVYWAAALGGCEGEKVGFEELAKSCREVDAGSLENHKGGVNSVTSLTVQNAYRRARKLYDKLDCVQESALADGDREALLSKRIKQWMKLVAADWLVIGGRDELDLHRKRLLRLKWSEEEGSPPPVLQSEEVFLSDKSMREDLPVLGHLLWKLCISADRRAQGRVFFDKTERNLPMAAGVLLLAGVLLGGAAWDDRVDRRAGVEAVVSALDRSGSLDLLLEPTSRIVQRDRASRVAFLITYFRQHFDKHLGKLLMEDQEAAATIRKMHFVTHLVDGGEAPAGQSVLDRCEEVDMKQIVGFISATLRDVEVGLNHLGVKVRKVAGVKEVGGKREMYFNTTIT